MHLPLRVQTHSANCDAAARLILHTHACTFHCACKRILQTVMLLQDQTHTCMHPKCTQALCTALLHVRTHTHTHTCADTNTYMHTRVEKKTRVTAHTHVSRRWTLALHQSPSTGAGVSSSPLPVVCAIVRSSWPPHASWSQVCACTLARVCECLCSCVSVCYSAFLMATPRLMEPGLCVWRLVCVYAWVCECLCACVSVCYSAFLMATPRLMETHTHTHTNNTHTLILQCTTLR